MRLLVPLVAHFVSTLDQSSNKITLRIKYFIRRRLVDGLHVKITESSRLLVRCLPLYYEGLSWCNNMMITYCTEGDTSYELASPDVIAMLCASLILGIFAANKVAGVSGLPDT